MYTTRYTHRIVAVTIPEAEKLYRARHNGRSVTLNGARVFIKSLDPMGAFFHRSPRLILALRIEAWVKD